MQFIDLASQQKRIREQLENNILKVLDHGRYIMGPEIQTLEEQLADFCDVNYAVSCSSGTDALLMALMALDVGPGDAIITTPFTFIATAEVIQLLGAVPVFVDIDEKDFNLDTEQINQALQALKSGNTKDYPLPQGVGGQLNPKAIIGVDLFGLPADYEKIVAIAREHQLIVIEDAAQSFGAEYKGEMACALADIGCTSFFPAKPLGCYGDGGMCFTNDSLLNEKISSIRIHGKGKDKYDNIRIGINGRLDTLQAAILLAKFAIFPQEIDMRQHVAKRYQEGLKGINKLKTPEIPSTSKSAWAQYSLVASDRNTRILYQEGLKKEGIPTAVYYPKPLHIQSAFRGLGYKPGDFPVSEDISNRIFSLPMHPYLSDQDQQQIIEIIQKISG